MANVNIADMSMEDVDLLEDLFGFNTTGDPFGPTGLTTDVPHAELPTDGPPLAKRPRPSDFDGSAPEIDTTMPTSKVVSPYQTMGTDMFSPLTSVPDATVTPIHNPQDSQTILEQIRREVEGFQEQLKHIEVEQQNLPVPVQQQDFESLDIDQKNMISQCYSFKEHLENIICTNILSPQYNYLLLSLDHDLNVLLKKLSLYQEELHYYCSFHQNSEPRCFCSLVILKQPFPKPIKHNTRAQNIETEEPVIVELISAPKASCSPEGCVKAQLMHEDFHSKRGSVEITNSQQPLDTEGFARFPDLRFPSGSRQKVVRLQFVVEVTYLQNNAVAGSQQLESDLTQPFIVMTNENQWKVSEGALLKKTTFEGKDVVPWAKFANLLQVHYLRATRQSLYEPKRPLSLRDIHYISQLEQFKNQPQVHVRDFESFWNWFGDAMHKIRHQKIFSTMWLEGEIFGFIDKAEVARVVYGNGTGGTFLIRFSERSSGSVAVAYSEVDVTSGRLKLKHYLVKPKEFENLVDFLHTHSNFQWLIPAKTDFSCRADNCARSRVLKRDFTAKYLTPSKEDTVLGYDPLTDNTQGPFFVDI